MVRTKRSSINSNLLSSLRTFTAFHYRFFFSFFQQRFEHNLNRRAIAFHRRLLRVVVNSISNVFDGYSLLGKRLFVLILWAQQNIICTYVHAVDQPVEIYVQSADKSNLPGKSNRAFVEIINTKPFD